MQQRHLVLAHTHTQNFFGVRQGPHTPSPHPHLYYLCVTLFVCVGVCLRKKEKKDR